MKKYLFLSTLITLILLLLSSCNEQKKNPVLHSVAIDSSDECHLCGMIIGNFPGPKGEVFIRNQNQVKKFCSTRDLFSFLLQPDIKHRVAQVFVHDMAITAWDIPSNDAFIDARKAFYVVDHQRKGAMGPTLASFKTREAALAFKQLFGGRVITFSDITLELLTGLVDLPRVDNNVFTRG